MVKIAIIGETEPKHEGLSKLKRIKADKAAGINGVEMFSGIVENADVLYISRAQNFFVFQEKEAAEKYKLLFIMLKKINCKVVLSASDCASLQEEIRPGELIIPDQFIDFSGTLFPRCSPDFTRGRMAEPFSQEIRDHFTEAAIICGITVHNKGTVAVTGAGRYSTRAESMLYHKWGCDITDMVTSQEVVAACEAGIPFAQVSFCRAYDAWRLPGNDLPGEKEIDKAYGNLFRVVLYAVKKINC